ncbi:DUF1853 family protein [Paraburkholderia dioscoreae]|uniref:DUF1853 family protein n=1 Tax=Paraburkholderia dioscoreae TaxID=2604047 RepID=A0A5Q4ZD21_9BURK|nr:DUF1853 family protein [Paraburkholderia dioscoreae]VVD29077.1 conserved protein of unknown function [Paraburkholderia dioscoreae]
MTAGGAAAGSSGAPGIDAASRATLLDSLHDPSVRALAWLLLSADLLRPQPPVGVLANPFETQQEAQATVDWLRALDAAPEPLHHDLAATRITRLGRYAERLLGWFLQHGPAARLVVAGVPLRRAGVTLGECDFLVQTQRGARLHWELAVKCYLHAGEERGQSIAPLSAQSSGSPSTPSPTSSLAQLSNYVGPNLKDRFDLKLAHVLAHQLPLSAREEFASVGYPGPWTPQMFIKGWLFYRHGETPSDPVELDPAHGRGWWVTRSDWLAFAAAATQKWRTLPRLEWLAPQRHSADEAQSAGLSFVDAPTLAGQTSHQPGPAMVAAFAEDSAGNLIERSRGFIVPDEWPEQARNYAQQ